MLRLLKFPALFLGALIFCAPAFAQDQQPSLGDIARQARKDKENSAVKAKITVTEDSLPARKSAVSALSEMNAPGSGNGSSEEDPLAGAMAQFEAAEADYNRLAALDQATLAKVALAEDCQVQFPSRSAWEVKLYAAKEQYVTHMHYVIADLKKATTEAEGWKGADGKLDPNDPRVQGFRRRMQSSWADAMQADAAFESVVAEGVALARAAKQR